MLNSTRRSGFTSIELLVVVTLVCVLLALALPAVLRSRADARRQACVRNLKEVALALHNFQETRFKFPAGWTTKSEATGAGPRFGWMLMILPYVNHKDIYHQIPWGKPLPPSANPLFVQRIDLFRCPADVSPDTNALRSGYGTANYSGNAGAAMPMQWAPERRGRWWPGRIDAEPYVRSNPRYRGFFGMNSQVDFRDIVDGSTNTLFVGERCVTSGAGIWPGVGDNAYPSDQVTPCTPANLLNANRRSFSSLHAGGANFALGDGSVRFISNKIAPSTYQAAATIAGGENEWLP